MPGHRPSRWSNESNRQASALWNFTFGKRQRGGRKKEVNKYMPNDFVYRWLMKRVRQGQVESIWGCGERVDGFSVGDEEKSPGGSDLWTDGLMTRSIQLSKEVRPGCANQREQQVQRPQKKNELDVIEGKKKGNMLNEEKMRWGGWQSPDCIWFYRWWLGLWIYSRKDGEVSGEVYALEPNESKVWLIV